MVNIWLIYGYGLFGRRQKTTSGGVGLALAVRRLRGNFDHPQLRGAKLFVTMSDPLECGAP